MTVPEHLRRYPTAVAIASLVERFNFPYDRNMQDWEWEVADSERVGEFVDAYCSGELDDDERFTLMETIIQSCEDHPLPLTDQPHWTGVMELLRAGAQLHAATIWYWSCLDEQGTPEEISEPVAEVSAQERVWRVTPHLRSLIRDQPDLFEASPQ